LPRSRDTRLMTKKGELEKKKNRVSPRGNPTVPKKRGATRFGMGKSQLTKAY